VDKDEMHDTIEEMNKDTCAAFALFWNMCRSWLPAGIIDDIDNFVINSGLPPMHPDVQEGHEGEYNIKRDDGLTISFTGVCLAPPMGLAANNYARWMFN